MTEATDCSLPLPHRDIAKPTPVPALAYPLGAQAPTTLAQLTTTRIGGPIASYLEAHSEQEMIEAIKQADAAGTPLLVVGGGSAWCYATPAVKSPSTQIPNAGEWSSPSPPA